MTNRPRTLTKLVLSLAFTAIAARSIVVLADAKPKPLTRPDLAWLDRVTFGIDPSAVSDYQRLGRERFLDAQLRPSEDSPQLRAAIAALAISQQSAEQRLTGIRAEQQRINALATEDEKQKARTTINQAGNQAVYETSKRQLIRDIGSSSQLREQMTWFWMNHFNVFQGKANVRWTLAEHEDAVRAHALGKFSDLVMATVTSPAMLEYLDNAQSAVNHINENYARELMELHVLGVSGGPSGSAYTQQDVQELARVLTGAGFYNGTAPKLNPRQQALYTRRALFEFNPARHDANVKTVLGHTIEPGGVDEIERAVVLLCRQPAAARFIAARLATYFVADDPPKGLVDRMARTFQQTDGSITAVLRTMFLDREVVASLGTSARTAQKFKDPVVFVVSSLRFAYAGKTITNYHPIVGWLQQLGEPLYGRVTPDGYPVTEAGWTSSGQLVKRFEIARAIGSGNAGLFNNDDNSPGPVTGFPMLTSRLFFDAIEASLAPNTRDALGQTSSQQEWNTLLLASPDWMMR